MITVEFLCAATGGAVVRAKEKSFASVAIDGRTVAAKALWFAIRGARFDGHDFAKQAVERGAAGLVVERGRGRAVLKAIGAQARATVIEVDDTVRALGELGQAHRAALPELKVVGITGSNGKTSTKDLVAAILASHAGESAVWKTQGNFNNHLGLPLTLLGLTSAHRYAVIEMGMSARGEIAYLAKLAQPDVGAIVNIGPVHLAELGSLDEVAHAKGELLAALSVRGTAIVPDGDERLAREAAATPAVRRMRFGTRSGVEVRLVRAATSGAGTDLVLRLPDGQRLETRLPLLGVHNGLNGACAAGVAYALGVPSIAIAAGLARARPEKHRSMAIEVGGRRVLDDCYNASPLSMAAALELLATLKGTGRAVAVLGDMLELGPDEEQLHAEVGERAAQAGIDFLILIGERARHIATGARRGGMAPGSIAFATSSEEAAGWAVYHSRPGDWILVKGSRGMKLERVIDALQAHPQSGAG